MIIKKKIEKKRYNVFQSFRIFTDNFFRDVTSVKAAIRVSEWTRHKVSSMKWNADGVCVMSGYEELLRDDKFSVAQ